MKTKRMRKRTRRARSGEETSASEQTKRNAK
jgi:hypothetical protein